MVLLQLLPVAGFLNKNVKMSQDNSARIYQDRLQDKSVIMCLLKSVIMFLALFPGKNARMFQQNNVGVLRETRARMYPNKFVAVFQKPNVRAFPGEYQDRNARMF